MDVFSIIRNSLSSDGVNPILQYYRLVKQVGGAGQEMVWKIYDAVRINDGKEASVFVFDKRAADKLHKPKRREIVTELLRREVSQLTRIKHPRLLRPLHPLEECNDNLAFATEPVVGSLANLLGNWDKLPVNIQQDTKDFSFLDVELRYGILQVTEALCYLHSTERLLHLNICPQNVVVTKRGMWKLTGLAFSQTIADSNAKDCLSSLVRPWVAKQSKMAQPDLDFIAPEVQMETVKLATTGCDIFSLGMFICSIYNGGRSILQANYSPPMYMKQIERMSELFSEVVPRMPIQLVEPIERMINRDIRYRPTTQQFMLLKWFDDAVVQCMQTIDAIDVKDTTMKREFFTVLPQAIPQFPRKLLYNCVFATLRELTDSPDMLILVLPTLISLINHATDEDYRQLLQPELHKIIAMTRPVQATVYLLERLDVLMAKASEEDVRSDILPMIFSMLESNSIQGQEAAINVFSTIKKYLDDQTMRKLVLPKAKALFNKSNNVRTRLNALECIDRLLDSLDKMIILDDVLPFLTEIQCSDVDIIVSVVCIYRHLLSDRRFGMTHNLLATKVMPTLIPLTVTPGLSIDQFSLLMEVLHDMLDQIERQRLSKMVSEMPDDDTLLDSRRTLLEARLKRPTVAVTGPCQGQGQSQCDPYSNKSLLNVDGNYFSKCRPPSTPELLTNDTLSDKFGPPAYRRHSSFQGLGMAEQAVLDSVVRQRRASIMMSQGPPGTLLPPGVAATPHILVSEASMSDLGDGSFLNPFGSRRSSTVSTGPVLVPDIGRRDSYGRLVTRGHTVSRRSSFQGICETAMQFFTGK